MRTAALAIFAVIPFGTVLPFELLLEVPAVVQTGQRVRPAHPVQLDVALAQLVLQLLDVYGGGHPGDELRRLERLLQVVVCAAVQPGHHVLHPRSAGEEDHRDVLQFRRP